MSQTIDRTILFLSDDAEQSQQASDLFNTEATNSELAWSSQSGITTDLSKLQMPDLLVVLHNAPQPNAVSARQGTTVEYWKIGAPNEVPAIIDKHIRNLIVKLILKGGKRQPLAVPAPAAQTISAKDAKAAQVRIALESKGRGGKKVSVISGLPLDEASLEELATKLKRACGTGGTSKDGQIEIQGDHRDKLISELQKLGYKPKKSGG